MLSLIIAMIWQAVGYYMVMYMASMAAVPVDLYESSSIDGAGRFTQFFKITIPLIWTNTPHHAHLLHHLHHQYGLPLRQGHDLRRPPTARARWLSPICTGRRDAGLYGYSMAIGVIIFLFSFLLSALVNRATKRKPLEF